MAEPEDVIAEGALAATRLARDLWARNRAAARPVPPRLDDLRRRLELFVAAFFPDAPDIGIAEPPAPPSLLARFARRRYAHLHSASAIASTDGHRLRLPGRIDGIPGPAVLTRYQLLALEQAARATRGTAGIRPRDILRSDLYLLAESAEIDAMLVGLVPSLHAEMRRARREGRDARPAVSRPSPREQAVERLLLELLDADPASPPSPFTRTLDPAASLQWAAVRARAVRQLPGPYRGTAPVPLWGEINDPEAGRSPGGDMPDGAPTAPAGRSHRLSRRPAVRDAGDDEDDTEPGMWIVRTDDLQEKAEDPAGLQRPADRDDQADPGELAEAVSELPEARLVRSPGPVREVLEGQDPIPRSPAPGTFPTGCGIAYPEWDYRISAYHPRGVVVREQVAPPAAGDWVEGVLRQHASVLRNVRRDFERLRPRRTVLTRQPEGADLDIDAVVDAFADLRGGGLSDDRLYLDTRPLRRDIAIALLVDVSASTDGWMSGKRRIIDVEKEALLVVVEALAALGDPNEILAFSGEGPARVDIQVVKGFREKAGIGEVNRRIAGLEPGGYTRTGAALRHATVGLTAYAARHRLLLLVSDGRPNDLDLYEGRYGIEDTRMAVTEARLQGLHCFCLTVDRQAPRYASRIFGRDFAVLSHPERLPAVLAHVLRDLVRA